MTSSAVQKTFQKSKTLNNKYIFGDEIGKGAYGTVYKGLDVQNGDFVAIKQVSLDKIKQDELGAIMQEIELLQILNHKNIVKYIGSVKTKSHLHIILEFMENGSLASIIKPNKFGPFPESLVAVYISQVLEGLVYLHEQGVIHRDIKGANILTTKEGLVKLADFGVALKIPEGQLNSEAVVGTPYWMAPEVIDMSGVCPASDIWSVGSTVIELLTCKPPYFDGAPMNALYRIVMDEHPPIPDGLSPTITDFLHQCFKKDPRQRPEAKTLLSHPWIKNSRRPLHAYLRHSGTLRNIDEVGSVEAALSNSEQGHSSESSSTEKGSKTQLLSLAHTGTSNFSEDDDSITKITNQMTDKLEEDQVLTLSIENSLEKTTALTDNHDAQAESLTNGVAESSAGEHVKPYFAKKSKDQCPRKVVGGLTSSEGNGMNRFSDQPGDDSGDDLFHPLNVWAAEASTSSSQENGGRDLLRLMKGVMKEDGIGIATLGFEDRLHEENIFHLQAVEFNKLVSSLRSNEPEDMITSACQKLTTLFHHRPDLKTAFITQHSLLPLVELLEVPRTDVICSVLQVLNKIIIDNTDFQEQACLVGLVPAMMSFAMPDRPMEIRTEVAYFFQQLCRSSLFTLQMFIACGGIPILVGFLEADYANHREIVHIAIDGMLQVLKLQKSTSGNDFCRIAARKGILLRLANALYSLNEGTRQASRSGFHPGLQEPSRSSALLSLESTAPEKSSSSKVLDSVSLERVSMDWLKSEPSRYGVKARKSVEVASTGCMGHRNAKRPPSRHFSCPLEYLRHLTCMSNHKKADGFEFLEDEFAEVIRRGRDISNLPSNGMISSSLGVASHSGSIKPESSTSSGVQSHVVSPWNVHVAREYLEKVADILLEFAAADSGVKSFMCTQSLLNRLFRIFNKIEPPILLKLLRCINHLSTDAQCLEHLQRAGAIKHLIPNLTLIEGSLVSRIHHEVLNALFNLCKIDKRRQNLAVEYGIIPRLLEFITSGSPLRQYALPLLCDMAHASHQSRDQLRAHGGLDVFLSLLEDESWAVTILDSVAVCLSHDNEHRKVEQALLKKDAIKKLVKFFMCCPEQHFLHILETFLKIITKSPKLNTTLAVNGLTMLVITRLDNPNAMVRLTLLKMIKAIYEHHPRPEQLIIEHNLPRRLKNLIEERGQSCGKQVLVKQMATSLLKALHILTDF